jgi:hypothetical protein
MVRSAVGTSRRARRGELVRAGKVRARQTGQNHDMWAPKTYDPITGPSEADQAAREKDARIVAVRLQIRLAHDPVAHREIAAMLEVPA